MTEKTNLEGCALDIAVAKAMGFEFDRYANWYYLKSPLLPGNEAWHLVGWFINPNWQGMSLMVEWLNQEGVDVSLSIALESSYCELRDSMTGKVLGPMMISPIAPEAVALALVEYAKKEE